MTLAAILIPLVSALLLFVVPSGLQRAIVIVSGVFTLLTAFGLPQVGLYEVPWLGAFGVYLSLEPTGAGALLVTVAAFVMLVTSVYATFVIERRRGQFLALLLFMQAGLNGIFLAQDLVLFYIFWEATLVPSLILLGGWGLKKRREAAMKYLLYAVAGSFVMLVAVLSLRPLTGAESYRLTDLMAYTQLLPVSTQLWLFLGFTLAFAVKAPLWPVHGWLPDFHEQNHPSGIADVAGTLYKVGGWGFYAVALPLLPTAAALVSPYLLALSAFTAVYAAVLAVTQTHLKRMLAYASLSHMGLIGVGVFGLYLSGLNGAVYLLAAQMLSTGALFLISGMLYARRGSFELSEYGGLAKSAPALGAITLFVILASIGVPGLSNFPGEVMSLMGAFERNAFLGGFATLAVVAAGVYGINLYQRLFQVDAKTHVREVGRLELVALIPFIAGILWMGLFPNSYLARIEAQSVRVPTFDAPLTALPPEVMGDAQALGSGDHEAPAAGASDDEHTPVSGAEDNDGH